MKLSLSTKRHPESLAQVPSRRLDIKNYLTLYKKNKKYLARKIFIEIFPLLTYGAVFASLISITVSFMIPIIRLAPGAGLILLFALMGEALVWTQLSFYTSDTLEYLVEKHWPKKESEWTH